MNPSLARLVYAVVIIGLFYLNRDNSERTSGGLWIPVVWFWILGSRAVSAWLGMGYDAPSAEVLMEGSPTDALVFQALLVGGLAVLARRGGRPFSVLAANWPVVLYFSYCLVSVVWSDFPDVAMKRWVKATGDLIMALVVVTDAQPAAALRKLLSRVGFMLLPASVLLIKYYPQLGRTYSEWSGEAYYTGVTTNKNMLGLTTYILTMAAMWQVLRLWRRPGLNNRGRQLIAQCALLVAGIWLLSTGNSATSTACFAIGAFLMVVTGSRKLRGQPKKVHAVVLVLVALGGLVEVTGAHAELVHILGRSTNLTGRASEIWPLLIPMAPNSLVGAGFETFWLGPRLRKVWNAFPNLYISEAHNGYIEMYLNLGAIGLILIIVILLHGYYRCVAVFRRDPDSAILLLAYLLVAVIYSYTEAGFRMLNFGWGILLMAIISASVFQRTPVKCQG